MSENRKDSKTNQIKYSQPHVGCSRFIKSVNDCLDTRIMIAPRVSTSQQERNGNLAQQEEWLRNEAISRNKIIVGSYSRTEPGWDYENLKKLGNKARELSVQAIWVVCTNRLGRSKIDQGGTRTFPPSVAECEEMVEALGPNVTVYSVLHPKAKDKEQVVLLTKIGNQSKGKGGRPWSSKRCKARVIELHKDGFGVKRIAKIVSLESSRNVSVSQVKRWVKCSPA